MYLVHPGAFLLLIRAVVGNHHLHSGHHLFLSREAAPDLLEQKSKPPKCDLNEDSCNTMCRWLKMTEKTTQTGCPLFEWQLKSCEYNLPEARPAGSPAEPLDCAVNIMRSLVPSNEVANYVSSLDDCIEGLPARLNASCHVALGLVRGEIRDFLAETRLKADAAVLAKDLVDARARGEKALQTKEPKEEQEVIDLLSVLLGKAEKLPGHYLTDEVHKARNTLDKLAPIPAVRLQLVGAMEDGHAAFRTTELFKVKEAIVWLNVAVQKGERYKVGPPLKEATDILEKLLVLKAALLDLHSAEFQGNISVGTRASVPEAIETLDAAMDRAKAAGLTDAMPLANTMLTKLRQFKAAVDDEDNATAFGRSILETSGNKGKGTLETGVSQLSSAIARAEKLGLGDNSSTAAAIDTLHRLKYIQHARQALQDAISQGRAVVEQAGAVLSDNAEESAIANIEPAIKWGEEVGLVNGMGMAGDLGTKLKNIEKSKEGMAVALARGNATLEAKSHIPEAIQTLEAAITSDNNVGISAGVNTAQEQIKLLKALMAALTTIKEATKTAKKSVDSRSDYDDAVNALRAAIEDGKDVGLNEEVAVAEEQLEKLEQFIKAEGEMTEAFALEPPARPDPNPADVDDRQPDTHFNRSGLKVEKLPAVPGGADDGDSDFDEHTKALAEAIGSAKTKGLIDPDQLAELATLKNLKTSYKMLQDAVGIGGEALKSKQHIQTAVVALTVALEEARESSLELNVPRGEDLLAKLSVIQPARDEMRAAILQANVSMKTVSGMDRALMRLNQAIDVNKQLGLFTEIPKAKKLADELMIVKKAFVALKAAVLQGQIALKEENGEEAAIDELNTAIEGADAIDLHKGMPLAVDLLHELMHMNAEKQQVQAAMNPRHGI